MNIGAESKKDAVADGRTTLTFPDTPFSYDQQKCSRVVVSLTLVLIAGHTREHISVLWLSSHSSQSVSKRRSVFKRYMASSGQLQRSPQTPAWWGSMCVEGGATHSLQWAELLYPQPAARKGHGKKRRQEAARTATSFAHCFPDSLWDSEEAR